MFGFEMLKPNCYGFDVEQILFELDLQQLSCCSGFSPFPHIICGYGAF